MDDTASETAAWLLLVRTPGLGATGLLRLVEHCGSASGVLARIPELRRSGLDPASAAYLRHPDWRKVKQDLAWLALPHHVLLTWQDSRYPPALREIADPPPALFVAGTPAVLATPQVAVVGSRNPTPGGRDIAYQLAGQLAAVGLTITGGLARGVDTAGHRGALDAGGLSVAVAGTGLDQVYPRENRDLARRIAERGALVSEFPMGTPPRRENFPRRNRIISGLGAGVLVVEAALRSGSLITARHAANQGREVFAVPGSIYNPVARGCHALLRDGAKLVETAEDILEELTQPALGAGPAARLHPPAPELDEIQRRVLDALGYDPAPVDLVVTRTRLTAGTVSAILLALELRGLAICAPGGRYFRAGKGL